MCQTVFFSLYRKTDSSSIFPIPRRIWEHSSSGTDRLSFSYPLGIHCIHHRVCSTKSAWSERTKANSVRHMISRKVAWLSVRMKMSQWISSSVNYATAILQPEKKQPIQFSMDLKIGVGRSTGCWFLWGSDSWLPHLPWWWNAWDLNAKLSDQKPMKINLIGFQTISRVPYSWTISTMYLRLSVYSPFTELKATESKYSNEWH